MRNFKTTLLAATIIAGIASPAYAQFAFPQAELDGAGASTPSDIQTKVNYCIGVGNGLKTNLGKSDGTFPSTTAADYTPAAPSATNPNLICSTSDDVYNGGATPETNGSANSFTGLYLSTGSGTGKKIWRLFDAAGVLTGAAGLIWPTTTTDPTGNTLGLFPATAWAHVQYALSESPLIDSDFTDYNAAGKGKDNGGNAIQIPLYVVPIALAYNQSYGLNPSSQAMNFNNKYPVTVNGVAAGGLRMKKLTYCKIWNGQITNWNDDALKTDNGAQALFDPITDNATRWGHTTAGVLTGEGAPIRLVGRADKSGATDVTTRAFSEQCKTLGAANKFLNGAESLPFDYAGSGNVDATQLNSSSNYKNQAYDATKFAGSVNSVSTYGWDKNGVSCLISAVSGGVCSAAAVANTPGLIMIADGSGNVEKAIKAATGTALFTLASGAKTDGKLGYIGGDFIAPTPGPKTLFAAALQIGAGAAYAMPNATTAGQAVGTITAPQAATSGNYVASDARFVPNDLTKTKAIVVANGGTYNPATDQHHPLRTIPQDWVNVFYPVDAAGDATTPTLANPAAGYPITGTSNLLTYTCFDSIGKRSAIANMIGYINGKITKKQDSVTGVPAASALSANTFPGVAAANLGILAKSNIGAVPAGWRTAISTTFLANTITGPNAAVGPLNLWIQSAQATTNNTTSAAVTNFKNVKSNSACAIGNTGTVPGA